MTSPAPHVAAAREPDVCGFRLYVERDNRNAQATYRALGMHQTDYLLLEQLRPGVVYLRDDAGGGDSQAGGEPRG